MNIQQLRRLYLQPKLKGNFHSENYTLDQLHIHTKIQSKITLNAL